MKVIDFPTRFILCCLLMAFFMPCLAIVAQKYTPEIDMKDEPGGLKIELSCNTHKINIKDEIVFDVKLVNIGKDKLSILGHLEWGWMGGLGMRVTDEAGQSVYSEMYDDYLMPPTVLIRPSSYITLSPNCYCGAIRPDTAKNIFRKPGIYSVVIVYLSPVSENFVYEYVKPVNFWGRNRGLIKSLPIWIEVTGD